MKVLHVITGLGSGGAEAVLYRLTTGDAHNKHSVVSLMDSGVYGERLANANIPVYALDMPRGRVTARGMVALYRLVRQIQPDVVQTWMYHADLIGGLVARFAAAKVVVWGIRGPFNVKRTPLSTKITIGLCAALSRWIPSVIVSNSAHAKGSHLKAGYSARKFVVIPNGYPLNQYRPDEKAGDMIRGELNVPFGTILLGMVARFDPYKDHDNLFRALRTASGNGLRFTCLLVGTGMDSSNKHLLRLIDEYGIGGVVKLMGPRSDVPRIMAALDVHVLSSVAESFPNVLAEAMACGTPCVTTDVGDAAMIVGDTGWVVPPSDYAALAQAIQEAIVTMRDVQTWNNRKTMCRQRVTENYGLERMIASYVSIWNGVS